jgi:hypothetical protein
LAVDAILLLKFKNIIKPQLVAILHPNRNPLVCSKLNVFDDFRLFN